MKKKKRKHDFHIICKVGLPDNDDANYLTCRVKIAGSFSKDNGDGNENVTNLHVQWAKTIALRALHVRFSFLSISLRSSAKQQREITKFEVLWRTSALEDTFSFLSPK